MKMAILEKILTCSEDYLLGFLKIPGQRKVPSIVLGLRDWIF